MQEKLENAHFTFCLLSVKSRQYVKFLSFALLLDSHKTVIRTVIGTVIGTVMSTVIGTAIGAVTGTVIETVIGVVIGAVIGTVIGTLSYSKWKLPFGTTKRNFPMI